MPNATPCPPTPNDWRDWQIIIPARLASTRLPEKLLQDLSGAPVIVRVAERLAPLRQQGAEVIVAADDQRLIDVCQAAGVTAIMTSSAHKTGSDRVHEASQLTGSDRPFVLNVQGDEPFIDLEVLANVKDSFEGQPDWDMVSAFHDNTSLSDFQSPHCVKVVVGANGRALYFSRAAIPSTKAGWSAANFRSFRQHLGIYGFSRDSLARYVTLPPSDLETCESLEQLRALEQGMVIGMVKSSLPAIGIDNQEDLDAARKAYDAQNP